jgi:MOSC domain-containing protein YiiM
LSENYQLLSVQVGTAQLLRVGGRQVMSGIHKQPVPHAVGVNPLGLDGDEQADLTVHGGLAKAVYAYPVEHYPFWKQQRRQWGLSPALPYGSLGENLTVSGLLEEALFVGDELHFPNVALRVTQPHEPCDKFNAWMGRRQAAKLMAQTGRCGFYPAVERAGSIMAGVVQIEDQLSGMRLNHQMHHQTILLVNVFPLPRSSLEAGINRIMRRTATSRMDSLRCRRFSSTSSSSWRSQVSFNPGISACVFPEMPARLPGTLRCHRTD